MLPLQSTSSKGDDFSDSENSSAKWWNKSMKEFSSLVTSSKLEKNSSSTNELFLTSLYEHIGIVCTCMFHTILEVVQIVNYILGILIKISNLKIVPNSHAILKLCKNIP